MSTKKEATPNEWDQSMADLLADGLRDQTVPSAARLCSGYEPIFPSMKGTTPNYYRMSNDVSKMGDKINNYRNELILFYIFYTRPGEEVQRKAAKALIDKKWRYSNRVSKWVTQTPDGWMEFDPVRWSIQPSLSFNPGQADFSTL